MKEIKDDKKLIISMTFIKQGNYDDNWSYFKSSVN